MRPSLQRALCAFAAAVAAVTVSRPATAQQPPDARAAAGYVAIAGINNGPALVTVNGRRHGTLMADEMTLTLAPGPYEVVISKTGYNACRRPVTVTSNDLVRVVCTLTPTAAHIVSDASQTGAAAQQTRTIRIIHLEPSAVPIVVGSDKGTTPATVRLPVGDDTILLNGQPLCLRVAPPAGEVDTDTLRLIVRAGRPQLVAGVRMCVPDVAAASELDAGRLALGQWRYQDRTQGRELGRYTRAVERVADGSLEVIRLVANRVRPDWRSIDTVTMDPGSLRPRRIRHVRLVGNDTESVFLDYSGTHVTGHVHMMEAAGVRYAAVEATPADGTLDVYQFWTLLPLLPLGENKSWRLDLFMASEARVRTISIWVRGREDVTVPAGTFACWKVDVSGRDQPPAAYYITRSAPYVVVKSAVSRPASSSELIR